MRKVEEDYPDWTPTPAYIHMLLKVASETNNLSLLTMQLDWLRFVLKDLWIEHQPLT